MNVKKQPKEQLYENVEKKKLFPSGRHKLIVKGARITPHSSGNGNMVSIWFEGIEGPSKGLAIYQLLALPSLKKERAKWFIQSNRIVGELLWASGDPKPIEFESDDAVIDLINSIQNPIIGNIIHEYSDYKEDDEAKFVFFNPYSRV
jgi:hypothetical protein